MYQFQNSRESLLGIYDTINSFRASNLNFEPFAHRSPMVLVFDRDAFNFIKADVVLHANSISMTGDSFVLAQRTSRWCSRIRVAIVRPVSPIYTLSESAHGIE